MQGKFILASGERFELVIRAVLWPSSKSRAATNVRTFEYYSFEIFTNERSLTPFGLFLAHTLRSEASAAAQASRVGAMHEWRYS